MAKLGKTESIRAVIAAAAAAEDKTHPPALVTGSVLVVALRRLRESGIPASSVVAMVVDYYAVNDVVFGEPSDG